MSQSPYADSPPPPAHTHRDGHRTVALLGSTGSIGTQAIDVITRNPDRFTATALSAGGRNLALLAEQAVRLQVELVGVADGDEAAVRGAITAAALLVFALAVLLAPGDPVPPGMVLLICGAATAVLGVALVVLVLRMLLAQAVARDVEAARMRAELEEVI